MFLDVLSAEAWRFFCDCAAVVVIVVASDGDVAGLEEEAAYGEALALARAVCVSRRCLYSFELVSKRAVHDGAVQVYVPEFAEVSDGREIGEEAGSSCDDCCD